MPSETMKSTDVFKCTNCGDCCKGYGGTFVTEKDIEDIADYIKADTEQFVKEYCQMSGEKPVLAQGKDGYCIFWDELCKIHPVKPRMCRQWPCLKSVLVDVANWHIMGAFCPGIRTDIPEHIIQEIVREELSKVHPADVKKTKHRSNK